MAALEELRLGNSAAASRAELDVIAEFFGVPVCYLTNTRVRTGIDAQLHLVKVMRDAGDLRPVHGSTLPALADTEGVNGQVDVPTGGQVKVPAPCG